MNVRTQSKAQQWAVWAFVALVALVAYVVLSVFLFGSVSWNVLSPERYRLAFPILVAAGVVAWTTRWDRVVRERRHRVRAAQEGSPAARESHGVATASGAAAGTSGATVVVREPQGNGGVPHVREVDAANSAKPQEATRRTEMTKHDGAEGDEANEGEETGERLYARARSIRHRPIPDYLNDARYLRLLIKAAHRGYASAMAKLGDYAMRRQTWVEAYYWMTLARCNGMHNLAPVLREIRKFWALRGCRDERSNENDFFPPEAASIGRAMLHKDSWRGDVAAKARAYLEEHCPESL